MSWRTNCANCNRIACTLISSIRSLSLSTEMRNSASVSVSSGLGLAPPASPNSKSSACSVKSVSINIFAVEI